MSRISVPPRVPSGSPSMWPVCVRSNRTRWVLSVGGAGRIADGHRADLLGGGDVALEQHRRHAQHVGHVVEAEARVVGRQQRRGVDVERQQIADRRSGTRRGSAGAAPDVPGWDWRRPRDRAWFRGTRPAPRAPAPSGCGMPCGGIAPDRTFLITFSHTAASPRRFARSSASSARSAVRVRELWHETQYLPTSAWCAAAPPPAARPSARAGAGAALCAAAPRAAAAARPGTGCSDRARRPGATGREPKVIDTGARLLETTVLPAAVMPASAASMSRTLSCSRNEPGSCTRDRAACPARPSAPGTRAAAASSASGSSPAGTRRRAGPSSPTRAGWTRTPAARR